MFRRRRPERTTQYIHREAMNRSALVTHALVVLSRDINVSVIGLVRRFKILSAPKGARVVNHMMFKKVVG